MKRVLLDENVPVALRTHLAEFTVETIHYLKLASCKDHDVLDVADTRYDVLITADKTLRFEQNLASRSVALIVLPTNRLALLLERMKEIRAAILSGKKLVIL